MKVKVQTPTCILCGNSTILEVDEAQFKEWQGGKLIQYAFPEMSATTRELLINGTHDHCFDIIHGEEE